VLVFARPGMIPGPALEDLVDKVKALDMVEVQRKAAEQEAEHARHESPDGKGKDDEASSGG
jgi:thioredoxin 1